MTAQKALKRIMMYDGERMHRIQYEGPVGSFATGQAKASVSGSPKGEGVRYLLADETATTA